MVPYDVVFYYYMIHRRYYIIEHYTGLVLLYFILWLVVWLYCSHVDFTWWPIKSDDEDAINEDM